MNIGLNIQRNIFNNLKPIANKTCALRRVVGHEFHFTYAKIAENLGAYSIIALIHSETKFEVCFHCIKSLFLQFICFKFIKKANAPAFLVHINNDSLAFFLYKLHSFVKLWAAIATARTKNISGKTRRMYPY